MTILIMVIKSTNADSSPDHEDDTRSIGVGEWDKSCSWQLLLWLMLMDVMMDDVIILMKDDDQDDLDPCPMINQPVDSWLVVSVAVVDYVAVTCCCYLNYY